MHNNIGCLSTLNEWIQAAKVEWNWFLQQFNQLQSLLVFHFTGIIACLPSFLKLCIQILYKYW